MSWATPPGRPCCTASFCLLPGSSVFITSTGCLYPKSVMSKSAAKAPGRCSTRASGLAPMMSAMDFLAASAVSIDTPDFSYESDIRHLNSGNAGGWPAFFDEPTTMVTGLGGADYTGG